MIDVIKPTKETALQYLAKVALTLPLELSRTTDTVLRSIPFASAPAAKQHHHNYRGGLAEHTSEVVWYCDYLASDNLDRSVLLTAAIWHDYTKIHEYAYRPNGDIYVQPFMPLIGHVVGSTYPFANAARMFNIDPVVERKIVHCMLTHHGRKEWGSPVEPKTPEAFILHAADMLSAQPLPTEI